MACEALMTIEPKIGAANDNLLPLQLLTAGGYFCL
jgi:hypothetical protein